MANGYCLPILAHIEALTSCNPAKKLPIMGFTQALLSQMDDSIKQQANAQYEDGHTRGMTVKYRKRPLLSLVSDTPSSCDTASTPVYNEFNMPSLLYREIPLFVPYSLIRQYCKDASEKVVIDHSDGSASMSDDGPTMVMNEVYEMMLEYAGTLMRSINQALVTQQATQFGVNLVSGTADASAIEFSLSGNSMQDAFVKLMTDLSDNQICNDVTLIGNGEFANIELVRQWFANAAADNGINKAQMLKDIPRVFRDNDTKTIWGPNQIGMFEKGSMSLITYDKNVGNFAGELGNSEFFNMLFPVDEYCCPQPYLDKMTLDVQIKEIDCPTTITLNGSSATVNQGVLIVMSKYFSLFTKPTTLYDVADELYGTNGALRYQITGS